MVEIKPFCGYIYNLEKVKNISNVISPPWDLINEELEKKLLSLSEYNIVKLIKKENFPEDVYKNLNKWIEDNILIKDNNEYFYFLEGIFEYKGKIHKRQGLLGILKLEDFETGNIIPHEKIFQKYSDNRYKLIEKCRSNFCPIFMLYQDKNFEIEKIIEKGKVYSEGKINNESFKFGKIENTENIEKIKKFFINKNLFIADGHHRYTASLLFFKNNPDEKNRYVLAYISNIESDGVLIFSTHRYIPAEVKLNFDEKLIKIFKVENLEKMEEEISEINKGRKMGMYYNNEFYVLDLKNYEKIIDADSLYKKIDSFIVDNYLIKNFVEIKENTEFLYHSSKEYLLDEYEKRKKGVIFFLNPVAKNLFIEICSNRKIMPQKSTYFYPKVPSGLVIYKF